MLWEINDIMNDINKLHFMRATLNYVLIVNLEKWNLTIEFQTLLKIILG